MTRAFLLTTAFALSAQLAAAAEWKELTAPGFTIVSDASEGTMHDAATDLSDFMSVADRVFTLKPGQLKPLTLVLLDKESELSPFLPLMAPGKTIDEATDEMDYETSSISGRGEDWYVVTAAAQDYERASRHAILQGAVYWYFQGIDYPVPRAFMTGMSEVLARFRRRISHAELGDPVVAYEQVLGSTPLIPVPALLAINDSRTLVQAKQRRLFAAESWTFVHYLMFGREPVRRRALGAFLDSLRAHASPSDALIAALGSDGAAHIDASLHSYLHNGLVVTQIPLGAHVEDRTPVSPASQADVQIALARADLPARAREAFAHIDAALAAAPSRPEAYQLRAEALMKTRGSRADIEHAILAAADRGSRSAWTLCEAGRIELDRDDGKTRTAVRLAERAANADHGYQPAFDLLGEALWRSPAAASDAPFLAYARGHWATDRWILVGQAALLRSTGDETGSQALLRQAEQPAGGLDDDQLQRVRAFLGVSF